MLGYRLMRTQVTAEEIRWLRERRGWTQAQLADELWTDAVTVSRWERGVSRPRSAVHRDLVRLILAEGPRGRTRFIEDPTTRLRRLEHALAEQLDLKRRVRLLD